MAKKKEPKAKARGIPVEVDTETTVEPWFVSAWAVQWLVTEELCWWLYLLNRPETVRVADLQPLVTNSDAIDYAVETKLVWQSLQKFISSDFKEVEQDKRIGPLLDRQLPILASAFALNDIAVKANDPRLSESATYALMSIQVLVHRYLVMDHEA